MDMNEVIKFLDFVNASPTPFHTIEVVKNELCEEGFAALNERDAWQIVPGGKYFVTRNQSSIIAFTVPEKGMSPFQIVASHSDSPTFKLKPHSEEETAGHYIRLNTEKYGGMIMSTWFDRPLSVAGRVLVKRGDSIGARLVNLDRDVLMIPSMPIHFNREINDGYKFNPQVDTLPLYGSKEHKGRLMKEIASAAGVEEEAIVGHDLFLYSRMAGSVWGAENEYFSCSRIDDLECAYTSLKAFLRAENAQQINVCAIFDNEEVGSTTKQGANSTFLNDVLTRTAYALGADDGEARAAIACSFMVSGDNAHAVHPNHPEKYDADNRTFMNGGIVVKYNANQKYTSDGVSAAIFQSICQKAGVPVQYFANRSDVIGGGTLGNIANTHASMNTVDIGLPQLAMHSVYETAGVKDLAYMIDGLKAFYETEIHMLGDGEFELK